MDTESLSRSVCGDSRDSKGERPRSQRTFPSRVGKSVCSGTEISRHLEKGGKLRTECSSTPFGRGVARTESRSGYESVSTRFSPVRKKKRTHKQTRRIRPLRTHTSVHTLPAFLTCTSDARAARRQVRRTVTHVCGPHSSGFFLLSSTSPTVQPRCPQLHE